MIILASQSPRRREILDFFAVPFTQISPDFDETLVPFRGDPAAFVLEIAKKKALSLQERYPHDAILSADTTVFQDNRIFAKPETLDEAFSMLKELSGKEHSVFTAVSVLRGKEQLTEVEETRVFFHELTNEQIRSYHHHFNPLDKAGAYAIQRGGSIIVKRIEGCYYNIMGLPLNTTRRLLGRIGISLWDSLKSL